MMRYLVVGLGLALGACSNTVSGLTVGPPAAIQRAASASIGTVVATDQRKEEPHRLATVLGLFGNPAKTLDTPKPVKDEVADAFIEGLRARGLMAAGGPAPFRVALVVRRFDADVYAGRGARIDLTLTVVNQAGATVYEDTAVDTEERGWKVFGGANINDLKELCEIVLARTVNTMLDKPAFRAAVGA